MITPLRYEARLNARPNFDREIFMFNIKILLVIAAGILPLLLAAPAACATNAPDGHPARTAASPASAFPEPADLLGVPYRDDGAIGEDGRNTLFANPEKTFPAPGLNCSGFVLAASRSILNTNFTLDHVKTDRLNDSGPQSPLGQDWDFGLDLILNISEGRPRRVLTPDGPKPLPAKADGQTLRGFALGDRNAWEKILPQMRPGHVYLASISKPSSRKGYVLLHYHVGMAIPDQNGRVWWYHSTPGSGVHRLDLNSPKGMAAFNKQFTGPKASRKHILLLEVDAPGE